MSEKKEIAYIKYGSHPGIKVYKDKWFTTIWFMGYKEIQISNDIAKDVLQDIVDKL